MAADTDLAPGALEPPELSESMLNRDLQHKLCFSDTTELVAHIMNLAMEHRHHTDDEPQVLIIGEVQLRCVP